MPTTIMLRPSLNKNKLTLGYTELVLSFYLTITAFSFTFYYF